MEELYKELQGRMSELESSESEEKDVRIKELTLVIVRVQQILLEKIDK